MARPRPPLGERTQEVNDETRHAHEGLLALAVELSAMCPYLLKAPWRRARDLLDVLGRGSNGGRHLVGCVKGYKVEWRG